MLADIVIHGGRLADWSAVGGARQDVPLRGGLAAVDGRIVAIGTDEEIRTWVGHGTEVVDARGGLIMPGFNDAHNHVISGGQVTARLTLRGLDSVAAIQQAVATHLRNTPGDQWVLGGGWDYRAFGGALPSRELLDQVSDHRPIYLVSSDAHTGWLNSAGLRAAGIDRHTPDPNNGTIVRVPETGEPTGVVKEDASRLVYAAVPATTPAEYDRALMAAVRGFTAKGITAVQDPRLDVREVPVWRARSADPDLTVRATLGLVMEPDQTLAEWRSRLAEYRRLIAPLTGDRKLSSGVIKAFLDGVIETRTAAMIEPYLGEHAHGNPAFEPDQLNAFVAEADREGWQLQLHAIGDRAVRMGLDAFACAARSNPPRPRRHRIEHLEVVDPADIRRFAGLGVIASVQPLHALANPGRVASWHEVIGQRRCRWAWPQAQIAATGGVIALGTDWPVVDFDPFTTLDAAVRRSNTDAEESQTPGTSNALALRQALIAYTAGSAHASFSEHRRGHLAPGMDADIVVLDRDLLAEGPSAVLGTRVVATVWDGRVAHRGDE